MPRESTTSTMIRPGDICPGTTNSSVDCWSSNPEIRRRRWRSTSARSSCSVTNRVTVY